MFKLVRNLIQLPHNLEAERSLLGALVLDPRGIDEVASVLSPDDFYAPKNATIFEHLIEMREKSDTIDGVTLGESLKAAGVIHDVGGPSGILDMISQAGTTSNVDNYADIIKDNSVLRSMVRVGDEIKHLGLERKADVTELVDGAEQLVYALGRYGFDKTEFSLMQALYDSMERLDAIAANGGELSGLATGFADLDAILGGLQPSTLNVVGARPAMGKAISISTPIPVPSGWETMGDIQPGDVVFDETGSHCNVTHISEVSVDRKCFEIVFDDGAEIVADAEHQWFAYDFPAWKSVRGRHLNAMGNEGKPKSVYSSDQTCRQKMPGVYTTQEMFDAGVTAGNADKRPNWYIQLAEPIVCENVELPVDPYVMGRWLVDGSKSGPAVTIGDFDVEHDKEQFGLAGYELRPLKTKYSYSCAPVDGGRDLREELRSVWLCDGQEKHIPDMYMRASETQRRSLLQGIMDGDGNVTGGSVEICLKGLDLLEQVKELAVSLGYKVNRPTEKHVSLNGKTVGPYYRISWIADDQDMFRMERKRQQLDERASHRKFGAGKRRAIRSITQVPSVPVKCISVDSPNRLYLAGRDMIPTHNSAFALTVAHHAAVVKRKPVIFFSLEMGDSELMQRLLAIDARVDSGKMRFGRMTDQDWQKIGSSVETMSDAPLIVNDRADISLSEIRAQCRRVGAKHGGVGLVIVDYVQLMDGRKNAESRQVQVAEISRGLKLLAKELEAPVLALAQLNRGLEARVDKRPMLSDLRESGSLEQDADVVMFLYRDEVYNPDSLDKGKAEVLIGKHRAGPIGVVELAFLPHYTMFADFADDSRF